MDIEKEYECEGCPYYRKKYSEKLGGYAEACIYISKVTAWACAKEEEN